MKHIMQFINKIIRELKILIQSPKMFYYRYFKCLIPNSVFGIKKDISINLMGHEIIFPNVGAQRVLMEIFLWDILKDIHGLNKVLDVGGFIGESAIYLSIYNKEVYVYELSPTNYDYLEKNCKGMKNIYYFNCCISNSNKEYIEFQDTGIVSSGNKKQQIGGNSIKIKNYNIIKLLNENVFDGLKLDIEGGEYDIIKPIIDSGLFNFKKGIIEFHELGRKENLKYLNYFLDYLKSNEYNHKIVSNENKKIKNIANITCCNVIFTKKIKYNKF